MNNNSNNHVQKRYKASSMKSKETIEQLVTDHLSLVKRVASWIARRLPKMVEIDELESAGAVGLFMAAMNYDPTQGNDFASYAKYRIKGAILDELRVMDRLSRRRRSQIAGMKKAEEEFVRVHKRSPSIEELAKILDVEPEKVHWMMIDAESSNVSSEFVILKERVDPSLSDGDSFDKMSKAEELQRLTEAVEKLPERLQTLLNLYYVSGATLQQIGEILGVSESRACQLHAQALDKIKINLTGVQNLAAAANM